MALWKLLFGLPRPWGKRANQTQRDAGDEAMRAWILDQREFRFFGFPQYWG